MDLLEILKEEDGFLLLIDGNSGAGKTTIGDFLKDELDCNLISIDDYYLPFSERKEDWYEIAGGNINYQRLIDEIVVPYKNKESFIIRRYNAHDDSFVEEIACEYKKRLIIEGSYSFVEDLGKHGDIKVFVKCDKQTQRNRLMLREGDNYTNFASRWVKKEDKYHKELKPLDMADYVIDTSEK